MKAVMFSIGTRGDIEPFLAIAEILSKKQWEVVCVFPEQFRGTVEALGFPFKGFDKAFLELLEGRDGKQFMGGKGSIVSRMAILFRMAKAGIKLSKGIIELQHKTLMAEKPDRVLYHPKCNFVLVWGMAHPGKSIMVSPIPGMAHTIKHLTALGGNYGKLLNRLSFWFVNTIKAFTINRVTQKYKKDYRGVVISSSNIKRAMLEKEKTFYAMSSSLFQRPAYWPDTAQVVGYYERDKTINWTPDNTLVQFFTRYEKIILITFGSMSNSAPMEKSRIIVDVLKRNNIPAIINTSWGGLQRIENSPEHIYFTDNIPYDWAFPKLYAVIHHGGAGTTHMSLKYGCPCLVVPHAVDQFFWAKTVYDLQLGPKGLAVKNINVKDFETRLLELLNTEAYKKNALNISERIKTESDQEKLYEQIIE